MKCGWSKFISGWLDNELTEKQRKEFEFHLKNCPVCQAEKNKMQGLSSLFTNIRSQKFPVFDKKLNLTDFSRKTIIPPVYKESLYKVALSFSMLAYVLRPENFDIDLNVTIIVYMLVHLFLYVRDLKDIKGFGLCPA